MAKASLKANLSRATQRIAKANQRADSSAERFPFTSKCFSLSLLLFLYHSNGRNAIAVYAHLRALRWNPLAFRACCRQLFRCLGCANRQRQPAKLVRRARSRLLLLLLLPPLLAQQ